ncbi:hypothetical protein C8C76_13218 [Halanaerobium saccharolyticum]|uniref:Uncharacterized protein n=1 Tax=Halanaerobium saccharolyticum TaxID=43595 RepID=A0A2T5RGZ1_9FIRM|nr:hypothetical protein [Halanaerobium saccharolyticum]PTV94444.1 hypothetical protein C8C76_13218 [Halanaerobium saccharolyticum]
MTSSDKGRSPKESLEQSLKEMKMMREGKMKKATWEEFRSSSRNDN